MATTQIAARIREAAAAQQRVRIVGGGHWLRAGHRVAANETLRVADDRGIVEYVPGDLTITARAGTPLADLRRAVAQNDQWLPLDPWGGDTGTLGATISTATAGPHAHAMGLPRDVVLGLEFVTGTGDTVRAGGRVVKNVAGFDLARLVIGSWGTLGVITEVTLRLRARPAELRTFSVAVDDSVEALNRLAVALRSLPFTPLAAELVNGNLARRVGVGDVTTLLVRIGGNRKSVDAQAAALASLGRLREASPNVWRELRECDGDAHATWRRSQLPSAFGETWTAVTRALTVLEDAYVHGSVFRGVARAVVSGSVPAVQRAMQQGVGTFALEVAPEGMQDVPRSTEGSGNGTLEQRIRTTFDPQHILNPGIMGNAA